MNNNDSITCDIIYQWLLLMMIFGQQWSDSQVQIIVRLHCYPVSPPPPPPPQKKKKKKKKDVHSKF